MCFVDVLVSKWSQQEKQRCRKAHRYRKHKVWSGVCVVTNPLVRLVSELRKEVALVARGTYSEGLLVVDGVVAPDFVGDTHVG